VALHDKNTSIIPANQNIIEELINLYEPILATFSAGIEINGIGPPKKPNPNEAPKAPPRIEKNKREIEKIIRAKIFGFLIIDFNYSCLNNQLFFCS